MGNTIEKIKLPQILKFIIPSVIGILLLMTPFATEKGTTVAVAELSRFINRTIASIVPIYYLVFICIIISCLLAIAAKVFKPGFIMGNEFLRSISDVSMFWLLARLLGLVISLVTIAQLGPEIIWSDNTGGLILYDLIGGLFTIFLIAGFILPFLTEFGLLEYVGVFLTKIMRPVFKLPGRSTVDCIASWIGDGTIGVALTNKQYEEGYYTEREAAVIATTFSAVSITFCLVVLENVGLTSHFGQFYLSVGVAGIVAALIVPRIPPLSRKRDIRLKLNRQAEVELIPDGYKPPQWALKQAVEKAASTGNCVDFIKSGTRTVLSLWLGVIPIIMAAGTLALVLSDATPIFTYLGKPFIPLLQLLGLPEAELASQTMVVGFADMVVPSILATNISSELTRFVVAGVSVTQLIYMSETGAVILGSKLPVNLFDLFIIFIERTLITLPVIVLMAHLFF